MLLRRLQYWKNRADRDQGMREEMEQHLAETAAELESNGLSPERARAEARKRFGNVGQKQEQSREVWFTRFLSELGQDLSYGCRAMAANKIFSVLAVLLLALGIGANTAIYSLVESLLLRSLPVADPESLVILNWQSRPPMDSNGQWVHVVHGLQGLFWPGNKGALVSGIFPYEAFESLRKDNPAFSTLFAYFSGLTRTVSLRGQAITAATEFVSGEYFGGLGVLPAAGRLISPEDDRPGAAPGAVISFAISQNRFGGPGKAIGESILVDNVPFTVIGVAPAEFSGVDPESVPALYLPLHSNVLLDGARAAQAYSDENFYWIEMMGRLRPGITKAQAQALLAPRFRRWVSATANTNGERANLPALVLNPGAGGLGSLRRKYSKPLSVLLVLVGLILAITCANIANLLLARAAARRREFAVRLSLGASRLRIVRQLVTESLTLALLGGAFGILFGLWGLRSLVLLLSGGQPDLIFHAALDWRVLGAAASLSIACGLLFGLAPALASTRPDVLPALKSSGGQGPRRRLQHLLVVAQMAISFTLLVAAGLFVQTLQKLHALPLGYARENVLLFSLDAHQAGHRDAEIPTFYTNLRQRFASIPGVTGATLSQSSIVSAGHAGKSYRGPIQIGANTIRGAGVLETGPRFLSTMQIPLLAGREIDERDQPGSLPVAVISERFARSYFPKENPLGRRLTFTGEKRSLEIVGVSADLRFGGLKDENPMTVFVAASQDSPEGVTFALRTAGDPLRYVQTVREILREADPRLPVTHVLTQAAEIDRTVNHEILFANLCTAFALLALLIACVGLYGTMSYNVARQVGEIGTRMALGAQRSQVMQMVLRRALLLAAAGLALSAPATWIASRLVKSFLFGTEPNDPATLAFAAIVLFAAALLAGYAPALRASRIDPLTALRQE